MIFRPAGWADRWAAWAALLLAAVFSSPGAESTDDPSNASDNKALARRPWVEMRSEGFCAYTSGSTQMMAMVLARLEQFRFAYSQMAGPQTVVSQPIEVYAFESNADFSPFKPVYEGRPSNVAGYFMRRSDSLIIALSLSADITNTLRVLFHEYTHFLLRKNHHWPTWLSEGMAELYSTLELQGDSVVLGRPPPDHLRTLADEPLVPLQRLFAVTHESPDYNESDKQGVFYAQSWLLTHYLATGDDVARRKRFGNYTNLARDERAPENAFVRAMSTSLPAMEKELKNYLVQGRFKPLTLKAGSRPRVYMNQRPLGHAEMSFLLGYLLLQLKREDEGRQFFAEALRLGPKEPYGHQGLGLIEAYQKHSGEAIRHLEQAQRLGAKSYLFHYWLGRERLMLLKDSDGSFRTLSPEKASQLNGIRSSLGESIRLMPRFPLAHYYLGFLELLQGDNLFSAETHLADAYRLVPDESRFGLTLAQAYLAQQKEEVARILLKEISETGVTREAKAEATRMLGQIAATGNR
jgi:tetratricopeptide (TPR) repeat protein